MLQFAHAIASTLLIIYGLLSVLIFGSPWEKQVIRNLEESKLYYELRTVHTILGIIMLLAGFYIAHW